MKSFLQTTLGALGVGLIAVGLGAGIAYAADYQLGPSATANITMEADWLTAGNDYLGFGTGDDYILFGDGVAGILYEFAFSLDDDIIMYWPGTTTTDDTLDIRADEITMMANNGNVVIQLGN